MVAKQDLSLNENNDEEVLAALTTNQPTTGTTLDLTGLTVEAFLKVNAATGDADASTWKGSTATTGVTITNAVDGQVSILIPASAVTTAKTFWRLDVLDGGLRKTALYGAVTVLDL